ncbi:MAG: TonB-dependent receptor [Comamonadaceae bacterium]|nr:TonB-dependent receptor [Comamonadaceae bacterium]
MAFVRGTRPIAIETGTVTGNLPEIPRSPGGPSCASTTAGCGARSRGSSRPGNPRSIQFSWRKPRRATSLANARLGVTLKTVRLWVGLNNIFNARFVEHLSYFRDPFRSGARVFEPGRNLFINLDYRF